MDSVKGKVELVGDRQQYVRLDDMVFPNPHSERMGELEWQLRYGDSELDRKGQIYAASIINAYREIVLLKTAKDRQYACSAIKWAGSTAKSRGRS